MLGARAEATGNAISNSQLKVGMRSESALQWVLMKVKVQGLSTRKWPKSGRQRSRLHGTVSDGCRRLGEAESTQLLCITIRS